MNETRIRDLRAGRGWSQEHLADESGVAVRTIQRLEAGQDASLETLSMVATALEVPVRELFVSVERDDFSAAVGGLDARIAEQRHSWAIARKAQRGWWALYVALGLGVTVFAIVWAGAHTSAGESELVLIVPAYWIGGLLFLLFFQKAVLGPRLDARYPLAARERHSRSRASRDATSPSEESE